MPNPADHWIDEDRRQPALNGSDRRAIPRRSPDGALNEIFGNLRKLREDALTPEQKETEGFWEAYEDIPPNS